MKLKSVKAINRGNVRALVEIETPEGEIWNGRIIKKPGARAWLDTQPHRLTHKQKRIAQREAVKAWVDQISETLLGLLESEKVFKGSRFKRLGVQLSAFCPVCDRRTPSEFPKSGRGGARNQCYFCATLRKGRPLIGKAELERINDAKLNANACQGTRGTDERMD